MAKVTMHNKNRGIKFFKNTNSNVPKYKLDKKDTAIAKRVNLKHSPIHPAHYVHGEHDLLYHLKDILTYDEYTGAIKFNIIKYVSRYKDKNGLEDLKKAQYYLGDLIKFEESKLGEVNEYDNRLS